LSPGAKLVYGRLCRYAGKNGDAYPALQTLASEVGLAKTQTRKYLRELEAEKFIEIDRRNLHYAASGAGGTYSYWFLWHKAFEGDTGYARKSPRSGTGLPKSGRVQKTTRVTPPETRTQRESGLRESRARGKPVRIPAQQGKASEGPSENCFSRPDAKSPGISGRDFSVPHAERLNTILDDDAELELLEGFIEEHEPDDTSDSGNGEWTPAATLSAGGGATAEEIIAFLEARMELGWWPSNHKAYPAIVRQEFERRRRKAAGVKWSERDLARVRGALKKYMGGSEPPSRTEYSCEFRANGATAEEVLNLLERRWASPKYLPGGKNGPRGWNWFLKVIGKEFSLLERARDP
jgi:hypothetical protein